MKILLVHNEYAQRGGEETVVGNESALLKDHGHDVITYFTCSASITGLRSVLKVAFNLVFSRTTYCELCALLKKEKPDVVHVHNTFPMITPSVFFACSDMGVPVVYTLHNYRLICPSATFFIKGQVNESALKNGPYSVVLNRPYRNSYFLSFLVARLIRWHSKNKTWSQKVNRFVVLSEFAKSKFVEFGLPPAKLRLKPNFVFDPLPAKGVVEVETSEEKYALYVGRLTEEKGVRVLLKAWEKTPYKLVICGSGPLEDEVTNFAKGHSVEFLGELDRKAITQLMLDAEILILPSLWYEGLPMVLLEGLACGLPVLASDIGSLGEVVTNDCGTTFCPGDAEDLRSKVVTCFEFPNPATRVSARKVYDQKYSSEISYRGLMEIYEQVV